MPQTKDYISNGSESADAAQLAISLEAPQYGEGIERGDEMRAKRVLALGIGLGALTGMATASGAAVECFRASASVCGGRPTFEVKGEVAPKTLPARVKTPVAVRAQGTIGTEDGSHPPTLREAVAYLDRNIEIDAAGFPACRVGGLTVRTDVAANCPDSIVGRGTAKIRFASGLPSAQVPLTFVNGGVTDGVVTLILQAEIPSGPHLTAVTVKRAPRGRYGYTATWETPPILGGSASPTEFRFKLKHGYVRARCPDGQLQARIVRALFSNEGEGAKTSTTFMGTVATPCTSKD